MGARWKSHTGMPFITSSRSTSGHTSAPSFSLTCSRKVDGKTIKQAVTVVETTREQIDTLIREVYSDNLDRQNEKRMDFVKLTVQIIKFEPGKPRGKDEWSYRLYRSSVDDIDRIISAIDNMDFKQ